MGKPLLVTITCLLLLTACSSVSTAEQDTVEKDASYASLETLRDAAVASGYECPSWHLEKHWGSCSDLDQFLAYPTEKAREEGQQSAIWGVQLTMVSTRELRAMLVGPNWIISGPVEPVTALKEQMGGYLPDISEFRSPFE